MSEINFCNTKEQLNHLGEVVTGKVDGSPSGADIDASTLPYTGQVRKTLPALEQEYLEAIQGAGGVSLGTWTSGVTTFTKYNEYSVYNGVPYKPRTTATLPYVSQGADPTASPDSANVQPYQEITEAQVVALVDAAIPVEVAKYTDIVYGSSVDMISGTPIVASQGDLVSIGSTRFEVSTVSKNGILLDSGLYANLKGKVHAIDFGDDLSSAMAIINSLFSSRITVSVINGMDISDTVTLGVDCDLDIKHAQLTNDLTLKPVFAPVDGWSGTCTPHYIDGKKFSALRGWTLLGEGYGVIDLYEPEFRNFGDEVANTSDSSWIGYHLLHKNSESINLHNAKCRDIYVKPNAVIGDVPGSNRNIVVTGEFNSGDVPTSISINDFTAVNLLTEEDSDAVVVECTSSDLTDVTIDVRITDGYSKNCQKRMLKFQTTSPPINLSGVTYHSNNGYADAGDSTKAVAVMDVQEGFNLVATGNIRCVGDWTYLYHGKQSKTTGGVNFSFETSSGQFVDGNTVRGIFLEDSATAELGDFNGVGCYEFFRVDAGCDLEIRDLKASIYGPLGFAAGNLKYRNLDCKMIGTTDLSSETGSLRCTANLKTGESDLDMTGMTNPPRSGWRCSGSQKVSMKDTVVTGATTATIELNNVPEAKLIRPENLTTSHTIRLEGTNGNIFIEAGRNPSSISFQPSGTTSNLDSKDERLY